VGNSRWEKPEIIFADVSDEAFALHIDSRKSRISVKHDGPFAARVPMQLAESTGSQSHVHAGYGLGNG